jgi:hypothetical protein
MIDWQGGGIKDEGKEMELNTLREVEKTGSCIVEREEALKKMNPGAQVCCASDDGSSSAKRMTNRRRRRRGGRRRSYIRDDTKNAAAIAKCGGENPTTGK